MRTRIASCLVLAFLAAGALVAAAGDPTGEYACPMSCEGDRVYEESGRCPVCGMALVKQDEILDVAILIFDGVQIIDFTGPYEVFGQQPFNVFTVSEKGETLTTAMGMSVNPEHSFDSSPAPDVLVVPGGDVHPAQDNPKVIDWIRKSAADARFVLSVCNGAFILASAGLLDGKSATTFYGLIDELKEFRPAVNVVRDRRFVDNGKVITSAGLSSGIDASLHVISRLRGIGEAQRLALHLEYDWRPDSGFARASLADMHLPRLSPLAGADVTVASTEGDRDRWEIRYAVHGDSSVKELLEHVEGQLREMKTWTQISSGTKGGTAETRWSFTDSEKRRWNSVMRFEPVDGRSDEFLVTVRIHKDGHRVPETS